MAAPVISRLVLTDDDGTGLTGTPLNNALFQDLQNRIDTLSAAIVAQFPVIPAGTVTAANFAKTQRDTNAQRSQFLTNPAAVTPDASVYDTVTLWGQAQALTINAPAWSNTYGITAYDGASLIIRIHDAGTAMAITWAVAGGYYPISGVPLPTATVPNVYYTLGFKYSAQHNAWQCVAQALGVF